MAVGQKQLIPLFAADKGLQTGQEALKSGTAIRLENAVFPRAGTIAKRTGTDRSAATYDGTAIAEFDETLLVYGDGNVKRYIPGDDAAHDPNTDSVAADAYHMLDVTDETYDTHPAPESANYLDIMDMGDLIGIVGYRFGADLLESTMRVYDKRTRVVIDSQQLSTGMAAVARSRFVRVGSVDQVYYAKTGGIYVRTIAADGTIGSETQVDSDISAAPFLDVCVVSNYVQLIHQTSTGFKLTSLEDGDPSTKNTAVIGAVTTPGNCACWPIGSSQVGLAWIATIAAADYVYGRIYDAAAATASTTQVTIKSASAGEINSVVGIEVPDIAGGYTTPSAVLYNDFNGSWASTREPPTVFESILHDVSGTGTATAPAVFCERAAIWTKPARLDTQTYDFYLGMMTEAYDVTNNTLSALAKPIQPTGVFVNQDALPIGRVFPGAARIGDGDAGWAVSLSDPRATGEDITCGTRIVKALTGASADEVLVVHSLSVSQVSATDLAADQRDSTELLLGGSSPYMYVGNLVLEQGFIQAPYPVSAATSTDVGSLTVDAAYNIKAVYERTLPNGRLQQSAPSPLPFVYTPTAADETKPDVTIPAPPFSFSGAITAVVYRTKGNGETYYRDGTAVIDMTAHPDTVAVSITISDADLGDNEVLYTDDGLLENQPPPPYRVATMHRNRHIVVPRLHETDRFRYSKTINEAEPVNHHENLVHSIDNAGGRITALASFLDRLIVFKEDRIFAVEGDGLDDGGQTGGFYPAHLISPSIGALKQSTLVHTPHGIMFAAADWMIWRLGLNNQVEPIGAAVKYFTDTYGPISDAAVLQDRHQALFLMPTFFGSPDYVLVYDWLYNTWCVYTDHGGRGIAAVSDELLRLDDDGYIWQDDRANYDDNGAWIPLRVKIGWISAGAHQLVGEAAGGFGGWHRLKEFLIFGRFIGAHKLTVNVMYNGNPSLVHTKEFDPSDLEAFDYGKYFTGEHANYADQAYCLRFQPRQKASSYMIEIVDSEDSGDTAGYELAGLAAVVAPKPGLVRVGAARHIT